MEECVRYTLLRVEAALRQLDATLDQQFPYRDAEEVLGRIKGRWEGNRDILLRSPAHFPEVSVGHCFKALGDLRYFLPIVGYVARCASVRHAFEVYGPLKQMASKLLCPEGADADKYTIGLILSSTWDYTPQTTRQLVDLSDFVIIILPGCEAANPLLIPLAGHELGHAVWERESIGTQFWEEYPRSVTEFLIKYRKEHPDVDRDIGTRTDVNEIRTRLEEINNPTYSDACKLVRGQLEEFFCDFIGLYLFGESFVHAFAYFLSPDFSAPRSRKYPTVRSRLEQLGAACDRFAKEWGDNVYSPLPNLAAEFHERPAEDAKTPKGTTASDSRRLLYDEVDRISLSLTPRLLDEVVRLGRRKSWKELRNFSVDERKRIREACYLWVVPAERTKGLANILNAGWDVACDDRRFWQQHPILGVDDRRYRHDPEKVFEIKERRRGALYELLLKNIEVLEYEHIVSQPLPND